MNPSRTCQRSTKTGTTGIRGSAPGSSARGAPHDLAARLTSSGKEAHPSCSSRRPTLATPLTLPRQPDLEDPPSHQPRGVHRWWNSVVILCAVVTVFYLQHKIEWPHQATSCAEFKARFEQQPTTFAASSARFEQQRTSNRINGERISQCLRLRQLTESEIYTLMSPFSPSSSAASGPALHRHQAVFRPP